MNYILNTHHRSLMSGSLTETNEYGILLAEHFDLWKKHQGIQGSKMQPDPKGRYISESLASTTFLTPITENMVPEDLPYFFGQTGQLKPAFYVSQKESWAFNGNYYVSFKRVSYEEFCEFLPNTFQAEKMLPHLLMECE